MNNYKLMKYTLYFDKPDKYKIQIYGEHHSDYNYISFVKHFKKIALNTPNQKYVVVLELAKNTLEELRNGNITSRDSTRSISFLFARAINNNEFTHLQNVTFIFGDNRGEPFQNMLYQLEENINYYPDSEFTYKYYGYNDMLLDLHTIISCWNDEKKSFENAECIIYEVDTHLMNIKKYLEDGHKIYFNDVRRLLDFLWAMWVRIADCYVLDQTHKYINGDYNILIITGMLHVFDYVYLLNKYTPVKQVMCDRYTVSPSDLKYLFDENMFNHNAHFSWYKEKCEKIQQKIVVKPSIIQPPFQFKKPLSLKDTHYETFLRLNEKFRLKYLKYKMKYHKLRNTIFG
jgi:hypothetical protein